MEVNILEKFDYGKAILNNNSVVKSWANIYQGGLIVGETAAKSGVTLNGNVLVTNNYNNYLNIEPWLGGHGKIIGEAEIGSSEMRGALSPGNSNIGTLTIDGNLSFASKGYYDVEINKDYSDKAVVTGTATLDGILRLFSLEGSLANYVDKAKEWLILDSQILVGEFKSITSDFDFLGPKLRYDTNLANVYLSFDNIISKNRNTIPQISDNKIVTLNFTFLEEGDIHYSVANKISYRPLALNEVNSVMKAGKYWANMLSNYKTKRDDLYFDVYTVNEENAFAGSNSWSAADESFNNTVYAFMDAKELGPLPSISPNCEEFSLSCASSHGRIGIGFSSEHWTYDVNRNQNVMPWNLETTIIHELGHAFGIVGDTPAGVNGSAQNGFGPSKYEALLQDPDAPPIVKSVSYKYYYSDFYNLDPTTRNFTDWRANNASEHSQAVQYIFNLYKNININGDKYDIDAIEYGDTIVATAVRYINVNNGTKIQVGFDSRYFPAELRPHDDPLWIPAITATYNPADFDGYFHGKTAVTVYNDGNYDPNRAVPMEDEAHEQVESHFGLRNTLMTHRNFRNYASLIEVELAAFVDLGLPVDLKQYFGRSVYTSDNSSDKSIIDNHSYLLPDNKYSIGIHLYGDNNHFTQRGNIRVNGDASVGIRSDGYLNTINIAPNSTISANGAQGTGLLVAYGHDTNVNHQGHIEATGQGGVAAFFDIGVNMVDENYTDDGYGDYAQYSYYKVPWYWGDGSYKQEFTQASKYLDGALVNQFNVKGYLEGNLAAIYIGGNSHVNEINIIGNSAEIRGPIINDYYYKSDGRSTKLTFGKAYAVNNHTNNISINNSEPDPSFRFIIKNDILGYGAEVKDGYKGRYSGRGLFDVELHGGKTTLMYDATINVNSFTMESGATLLTTADFGHGLYPTITANDFNLKKGSIVDLDQTFLFGGTLVYNSKHNVLKLVNPEGKYNLLNFANKSETWAEFQTVSVKNIAVGAFDYLADLYWDDDKTTLIMQIVSPPEVSEERSGIQSTESASQMTVNTTTNSQNSVFEHISETSTARRRKRSAPSSGENDQAWALWLAPWYSYDHHDSQYGSEGFSVKSYGLTLGLDHTFQDGSPLIGLALSFGRPEAKSRFINNKGKAFSVSGYFSSALPYEFDVSAIVTYSFFDFDQTRWSDGVDYTADYDSKAVAVTLELGRSFDLSETWTLRPYGQVSYNHSDVDAYSESGRGPQAQVIAGNETDLWRTELGTSVIWNHSDRLTMVGKIGWGRNFKKKNEHTGYFSGDQPNPSYFKIETSPFDKNNVAYGLNAIIAVNDSVDIKLTYDGAASRHNTSHAGAITAVYNF
jgi:outer membrane autotransporter protein